MIDNQPEVSIEEQCERGPDVNRRIGLIVPSTNTVAEPDFYSGLPTNTSIHTARLLLGGGHAQDELDMVKNELPRAARDLATMRPHVVVFSCTTAGAVVGEAGEKDLINALSQTTGARVVSTNDAVRRALHGLAASSIALITPYLDGLTAAMQDSLRRDGLPITATAGMAISDPFEIAQVEPEAIVKFAAENLAGKEFDAIFLSCTNLRGLEAQDACSQHFGVPVITSNQAARDAAMALVAYH